MMNAQPDAMQTHARRTPVQRWRIFIVVLGGLVLCCLLGIAVIGLLQVYRRAQAQAWYRPSSEAPADLRWQALDPARIHRVAKDKQTEAIERLKEVAVAELTREQAAEYVGEPLPNVAGAKPYLVRSLIYFLPGQYNVRVADGHLAITHGSLGKWPTYKMRHAVVLQLDRKPEEVYADAWSAQ
jgi:hypothetical protein